MDAKEELKAKFLEHKDSTRVKVRFNDTDAMGIVHFKNYMVYFDDGFVSFMNSIRNRRKIEEMIHEGLACGVRHVDITYEGSAKFGDYIIVETEIKKLRNKSITFSHMLHKKSDMELIVKVESVRFVMDLKTHKLLNILEFLDYDLK